MKTVLVIIFTLIAFFTIDVEAQFKPSEQQNLRDHNALVNPGFENGKKGWIDGAGNVITFGSTDLLSKHAITTVSGAFVDYSQVVTSLVPFVGNQAIASCRINTSVSGIKFQVFNDATLSSELTVIGDGEWKEYKIPFMPNATSNTIKIVSDSNTVAAVAIDDCFMGLGKVAQIVNDTFTDWVEYTPTLTTSGGGAVTLNTTTYQPLWGRWRRSGDTIEVNVGFRNGTGAAATGAAGIVKISFPDGISFDFGTSSSLSDFVLGNYLGAADSSTSAQAIGSYQVFAGFISFGSGANPTIDVNDIVAGYAVATTSKFKVLGWSKEFSTVVAQQNELTDDELNVFGYMWIPSTNTFISKSDNINVVKNSTGFYTQTFTGLQNPPRCTYDGGNTNDDVNSPVVCGKKFGTLVTNTTNDVVCKQTARIDATVLHATCHRTGSDIRRSVSVHGKFKQIEEITADLTDQTANDFSARIFAGSVTQKTPFSDWLVGCTNATTAVCTYKVGIFTVPPHCQITPNRNDIKCGLNGSAQNNLTANIICTNSSGTNLTTTTEYVLDCTKADVDYNKSFKGAIINASESATKCQTKFLAANVSSTGVLTDLTFTNMTIGKWYSAIGKLALFRTNSTSNTKEFSYQLVDGVTQIQASQHRDVGTDWISAGILAVPFFKATGISMTLNLSAMTNAQIISGSSQTFITLCELSGNYVEGTKW